jgi:hypothetical protein
MMGSWHTDVFFLLQVASSILGEEGDEQWVCNDAVFSTKMAIFNLPLKILTFSN